MFKSIIPTLRDKKKKNERQPKRVENNKIEN